MATLVWAVTAQRIITDRDTNSVSYIDLVENFAVPVFPSQLPPFSIGTLWQRESGENSFTIRITFLSPNDDVYGPSI